jgi:hypothetical protein
LPRCGEMFFRAWDDRPSRETWQSSPFASSCQHCGLPKCRRRRQYVLLADEPVPSIKQVDTVVNTSVQRCAAFQWFHTVMAMMIPKPM